MSIYAIGDIHGALKALETVFEKGDFKTDDTLIFLGDYVNKGPDSKRVLDFLCEKSKSYTCIFLKGNHEIMMLDARNDQDDLRKWLYFGGAKTLDSYGIGDEADWADKIPQTHWDFIKSGLPYYEYEDFIFVHAGLSTGIPLPEQFDESLYWKKYLTPKPYHPEKVVICGHTSRKNGEIADFEHSICIDTYAHGGMWLTCLNAKDKSFLQANQLGEFRSGNLSRNIN